MNTRYIAKELRLSHWAQIMKERRNSGLSIKAFCESAGFHENVYYYWQRKLREVAYNALPDKISELIIKPQGEVIDSGKYPVPSGWTMCEPVKTADKGKILPIEINGCRVLADNEVDPETLVKVCRALMSLC